MRRWRRRGISPWRAGACRHPGRRSSRPPGRTRRRALGDGHRSHEVPDCAAGPARSFRCVLSTARGRARHPRRGGATRPPVRVEVEDVGHAPRRLRRVAPHHADRFAPPPPLLPHRAARTPGASRRRPIHGLAMRIAARNRLRPRRASHERESRAGVVKHAVEEGPPPFVRIGEHAGTDSARAPGAHPSVHVIREVPRALQPRKRSFPCLRIRTALPAAFAAARRAHRGHVRGRRTRAAAPVTALVKARVKIGRSAQCLQAACAAGTPGVVSRYGSLGAARANHLLLGNKPGHWRGFALPRCPWAVLARELGARHARALAAPLPLRLDVPGGLRRPGLCVPATVYRAPSSPQPVGFGLGPTGQRRAESGSLRSRGGPSRSGPWRGCAFRTASLPRNASRLRRSRVRRTCR